MNHTGTFLLDYFSDFEWHPAYLTIDYISAGGLPCPFAAHLPPYTLHLDPTSFAYLGLHTFRLTLSDTQNSSVSYFEVEVYNTAPVFVPDVAPMDMRVRFNHSFEWYYPPMYDE